MNGGEGPLSISFFLILFISELEGKVVAGRNLAGKLKRKHPLTNSKNVLYGCKIHRDFLLALGAMSCSEVMRSLLQHKFFSLTFSLPDLCLSFNIQTWLLIGHTKKGEASDFFLFNVEVYITHDGKPFCVQPKSLTQKRGPFPGLAIKHFFWEVGGRSIKLGVLWPGF